MTRTLTNPPARRREKHNLDAIQTALCEKSFAFFMKQAWWVIEPYTQLVWGKVNDALCEHLEAVHHGKIRQLLITIPPGTLKSITVSVCFPAWVWLNAPGERFLTASNDRDLVLRDAVSCRELIRSEWYQERWGDRFRLSWDQDVKAWYKNDKKGFRTAVTVGQKVTGKKSTIQIIDDPDDAMAVRSHVERTKIHHWFDKGFYNRVDNHLTARRIIIGQCLDVDDLIAHVKKRGDFVHLNLPEEFSPADKCETPIGWKDWRTEAGELLRPTMFGPLQVQEAKARLRTSYHGQHNQKPISEGGDKFKAEWLRYYTRGEHGSLWQFGDKLYAPEEIKGRFVTVDPAFTEKKTTGKKTNDPDWTAISAWGTTPCGKLVWLGAFRIRCESPDGPPHVYRMLVRWGAHKAIVEGGGTQQGFLQLCERHQPHFSCVEVVPTRDKLNEASDLFAMASAGRLWLPSPDFDRNFPLTDVESELLEFPGGAHDDLFSTASMAEKEMAPKGTNRRTQMIGSGQRAGPLTPGVNMQGMPSQRRVQ